jgi:hypothetical protein
MGMSAEVLMVGPFSRSLVPFLSGPSEAYRALRDGAVIVERLAPMSVGSSTGHALAAALRLDAWNDDTLDFEPQHVDRPALRASLSTWLPGAVVEAAMARFDACAAAGFTFYFLANG